MVHNTTDTGGPINLNAAEQAGSMAPNGALPTTEVPLFTPPFDPKIVPQLPQMSIQQLNMLESQIDQEFSALAHDYIAARISRLNYIIHYLDLNIENSKESDHRWTEFYNSQINAVNELNNITENFILDAGKRSSRRSPDFYYHLEGEIDALMASMESPLQYDEMFNSDNETLPFKEYFAEIIDHHKIQISALQNLRKYHANYVESITEKYKVLSWKSCRSDILEHKNNLITKTCEELRDLQDEYYSIMPMSSLAQSDKSYYRSNVPVSKMKESDSESQSRLEIGNIDTYYDIDNVYYKNNRLEISDTKRAALAREQQFTSANHSHSIPQLESVSVKLDGCSGLSAADIESDLLALRAHSTAGIATDVENSDKVEEPQSSQARAIARAASERTENLSHKEYRELLNVNRTPSNIKLETSFE